MIPPMTPYDWLMVTLLVAFVVFGHWGYLVAAIILALAGAFVS